jgi:hypothetical protein
LTLFKTTENFATFHVPGRNRTNGHSHYYFTLTTCSLVGYYDGTLNPYAQPAKKNHCSLTPVAQDGEDNAEIKIA